MRRECKRFIRPRPPAPSAPPLGGLADLRRQTALGRAASCPISIAAYCWLLPAMSSPIIAGLARREDHHGIAPLRARSCRPGRACAKWAGPGGAARRGRRPALHPADLAGVHEVARRSSIVVSFQAGEFDRISRVTICSRAWGLRSRPVTTFGVAAGLGVCHRGWSSGRKDQGCAGRASPACGRAPGIEGWGCSIRPRRCSADVAEPHAADLGGWVLERSAAVGADHAPSSMNDSAISRTCSAVMCGQCRSRRCACTGSSSAQRTRLGPDSNASERGCRLTRTPRPGISVSVMSHLSRHRIAAS